jgi:formylglycine-generating enzyme required for sulfatase activity
VPTPSDQQPVKIVPKGLRSFDRADADFFLELLPGPRDRDGLPDSIRFWKTRIEAADPDSTFSMGLIYGPSGCGKSSLVKAGLLPRLAKSVTAVYVEATGEETEVRLLKGLRRQVTDLPASLGLVESLAVLRRGQFLAPGQRVLLVLDQFEQWLHAKRNEENTELVQALRHCDGVRMQGLVLVRDDFWMAVTRFLGQLEIDLVQGRNCAAVDLFPLAHAHKVLAAFGRAFGTLAQPDRTGKQFLDLAVAGLAQEGKVICVRLALFAEMMKGKPWTPSALKEVGGTEGVGVRFLEDTFSSAAANPKHRLHQKAARVVLKALLPEAGTDIKGHMRSRQELLEASGYTPRPRDFDDLLRILDSELRLITPTEPEGKDVGHVSNVPDPEGHVGNVPHGQHYQLTHDYLVPSLREWLTRKQKETRRGRAELLLADRAAVWNVRPENRQLPSLLQWFQLRWLTAKKNWTPPQRKMMTRATRFHAFRGLVAVVLAALLVWGAYEANGWLQAHALRGRLLDADTDQVPKIVEDMAPYRRWLDPLLHEAYAQAAAGKDTRKQLHASLALLPVDSTQVDYLYDRLLKAEPHEVRVICDALAAHKTELVDRLWPVVEKPGRGRESARLRAAAALAKYNPDSPGWDKVKEQLANDLVNVPAVYLADWKDALGPVRAKLLAPLGVVFRDGKRRETERSLATELLIEYAKDQPRVLADLLLDADVRQFAVLSPKLDTYAEEALAVIGKTVRISLEAQKTQDAKEGLAKRQANAAVLLLRLGQAEKVWLLLKHPAHPRPDAFGFSDPRVRSYLIHRLAVLGADPGVIVNRLDRENDISIRRALLLCLGEFGPAQLTAADRKRLLPKVVRLFREDADAGMHGAAEWLLRRWGQKEFIQQSEKEWVKDQPRRERRPQQIRGQIVRNKSKTYQGKGYWYLNSQSQTMVVIPGPVEFWIGSPPTEEGRTGGPEGTNEQQQRKQVNRHFAIAAKEVTVGQFTDPDFQKFFQEKAIGGFRYQRQFSPTADCPVSGVSWYDAAAYCNWLSAREGLDAAEWCYVPNAKGQYGPGMKLARDYLQRRGYRLPSEAEWEYACRAGAMTSRYYGETQELLGKYAWHMNNSLERWMLPGVPGQSGVPGDRLKPNDFGLFDMLGNANEWCQDPHPDHTPGEDKEYEEDVIFTDIRVFRGSTFANPAREIRAAVRSGYAPVHYYFHTGFRPARTFR